MHLILPFQPVEVEASRKLVSMLEPPDNLIELFLQDVSLKLDPTVSAQAARLLNFFITLPSISPDHPSLRAYITHPVRVAHFVLSAMTEPSADAVLTAILHNSFELSGLHEQELLNWGLSPSIVSSIRFLTIDRTREFDVNYLTDFYRAIEAFGPELTLVRCMDKLDNIFGSQIIENVQCRQLYIELADKFVTPMATRLSSSFGSYFAEACAFAFGAPHLPRTKQQIDSFVSADGALA
jgi:hypothetical protein